MSCRIHPAVLVLIAMLSCAFPVVSRAAEPSSAREPEALAREILSAAGVKGGLVVHLGCGDGKLTAALRATEAYLVHGLDKDRAHVAQARRHIHGRGVYGDVSVEPWAGDYLPYADNLVNLLVAEHLGEVTMQEALRVLAPGGVAYTKGRDGWTKTVKPRLKDTDEWTHALHGPDNNAVARDALVGPPRHLQWTGGPKWARSHDHLASISVVVSSGGRIFYIADEGPTAFVALPAQWRLVARDAYNGVVLWRRTIGPWEGHLRGFRSGPPSLARRLVAIGERVYVTLGYDKPLSALDAATGKVLRTYEGTDGATEVICHKGVLFLVAGDRAAEEKAEQGWRRGVTPPVHNKRILAVRAETGKLLWKKSDRDTVEVMPTTLAAAGGRVFFQNPQAILCLDAASGRELWRAKRPVSRSRLGWSTPTLVVSGGVVLSADRGAATKADGKALAKGEVDWVPSSAGGNAPAGELIAFSAETGQRLWNCPCREGYNSPVDVLVAGGLVWTGNLVRAREPGITAGRDIRTGQVKKQRPPDQKFFPVGMGHHRCYRNKATERYLILGRAGVEFIDLASGGGQADHWVRGACQYGVIPCNGLLYAPSHSCACYIEAKLNGFNALAARRSRPAAEGKSPSRLEKGPAYGQIGKPQPEIHNASDWPTYRHDPARSGRTGSAAPEKLSPAWQADLGGTLSSVVIAGGKLFVAQVDAHTVHALDARDGKKLWSYTAGGRVDSPPTIHKGMVLFGSADGYVYCLRASDGQLVWRLRAAPEERRVVSYGRVESAWPVHGNVLVVGDTAYCVAGRSAFTDGGMYLCRLDPVTGHLLSETHIDGRDAKTGREVNATVRGTHMAGALPDVLSSDGKSIWMRHKRFDLKGAGQKPDVPHLFSPAGFLDGSWWHRTYWLVGTSMQSGYGGWVRAGSAAPAGRILAVDGSTVYGFGRTHYTHHGSHVGLDATTVYHFRRTGDTRKRWTRYQLFSITRKAPTAARRPQVKAQPKAKTRPKGGKAKPKRRPAPAAKTYRWNRSAPLLVRAMVLAGDKLLVAGPPDVFGQRGQFAPVEGRKHGVLHVVSASDGQRLAACKLDSAPVFDGMAVAGGRIYVATLDGKVVCLASQQ